MSGRLFMDAIREGGAELIPIDSEHNAVFPVPSGPPAAGRGTADPADRLRGPFRDWSPRAIESVTPEAACAHPNWEMGPKISVDSATMMNKALEVIEACWLFETVRTGSRSSSIPRARCIRWWSTRTGRSSPSSGRRTCALPSRTPSPGPNASTPGCRGSTSPFRYGSTSSRRTSAGRPAFASATSRPRRGHPAHRAQRGQRGGGGRVPGPPGEVRRHSPRGGGNPSAAASNARRTTSTRSLDEDAAAREIAAALVG